MKIKALYRVTELAVMLGVSEDTMRRWIKREQMSVLRVGRSVCVPLASFRASFPQAWESVRLNSKLSSGKCEACGSKLDP